MSWKRKSEEPKTASERGKLGRQASPWNKQPHSVGWKAMLAHRRYTKRGPQQ